MKKLRVFVLLAVLTALWSAQASADLFYAVSDYVAGSVGLITRNSNGSFTVTPKVLVGLGGDAWGCTFLDQNGADKLVVREFQYSGANDVVSVYDFKNWTTPVANTTKWGRNLHGVASDGKNLYLALQDTYETGVGDISGQIARIPLSGLNGNTDRSHQYSPVSGKPKKTQGVVLWNDKVYALNGAWDGAFNHEQGEVTEFDADLKALRSAKVGKNPFEMAIYDGKAYVACQGGMLGAGLWGDIWEVDLASMTSEKVIDINKISAITFPSGAASISIAKDGTAFVIVGGYDPDDSWSYKPVLYVTTTDKLSRGDIGTLAPALTKNPGVGWLVRYDEALEILWLEGGIGIEARDKRGAVIRKFTPLELGGDAYSIDIWNSGIATNPDPDPNPDDPGTKPDDNGNGGNSGGGGGGCDSGTGSLLPLCALLAFGISGKFSRFVSWSKTASANETA
ncbi:MAG: hypothetical protein LBQ58_01965 [Synergistaceae bacterium]|nr:hypothetical protein [Synergistaceae bacterium]